MKTPLCLLAALSLAVLKVAAQDTAVPPHPSPDAEKPNVVATFPNAPVADILHYYAELTGLQVIYDNTVQGQITLQTNGKVTREQVVRLVEDTLFLNGFELVDTADGATVKVLGLSKNVRTEGVPICYALDNLPKRERIVSYVVRLKQADAVNMTGFLQHYVPPNQATSFTPGPGGTIILTARTSMIRPLARLVETMDVPPGEEAPAARPVVPPAAPEPLTVPRALMGPRPALNPTVNRPGTKPAPASDDDDDD